MKRFILVYLATALFLSVGASQTHAQIFRRVCPTGTCPIQSRVATVNFSRVYNPYSYAQAQSVAIVKPCEQATETTEAPEPCAPVAEVVEPCVPVAACEPVAEEYTPTCEKENVVETTIIDGCVGGSCPIRTAVAATANVAAQTVRNVAATTRFLLAVNRIRAQYNLPALSADSVLDSGCETQAAYCSRVGSLVHGGNSAEILAYNYSGFDAALVQWLNSPAHRALLLAPNYRAAGVAVVKGKDGRVWCAMRFR